MTVGEQAPAVSNLLGPVGDSAADPIPGSMSEEMNGIVNVCVVDTSGPRVFLELQLNEQSYIALADSGADISIITVSALEQIGDVVINSDFSFSFKGIGNNAPVSRTLGTVVLSMSMGGFVAPSATFHVVNDADVGHSVVLGADLMYKYYLAPSPAHQRLIYYPPDQ